MSDTDKAIWSCRVGEIDRGKIPPDADAPMRAAVSRAYHLVTGEWPAFIFSGWGAQLTDTEREIVENTAVKQNLDKSGGEMTEPKLEVEERLDRIEEAISTMNHWLVQAQTGYNSNDAKRVEGILRGEDFIEE